MNLRSILALFASAALLFCFRTPAVGADPHVVTITAVPSRFSPDEIVLHPNEPVTLRFSVSGVHGLYAPELGITHTVLADGQTTDVAIPPQEIGTYVLHCRIFCGAGHADMTLTIRVEA